ncbi:MAG: YbhB/YbcL family Raf kinase inhibitor-like protein [Verrucomicrobia bacterium]|nr:YbhB/YbcL family Raf kinase inhibitor-like protein [Kiritimatiellia bacterium]MCO6400523.1 YbhB/YbcL family Raf kinase inhibitor-like protein [Verrucomicrobiota bacterium]
MKLSSPAFQDGAPIPIRHTCKGENLSPQLDWSGAPAAETQSFALLVTDPDAPGGTFLHWLLFNIPATCKRLDAGIPNNFKLANGAVQCLNSFGKPGYGGPCPPPGENHRYFFELLALNARLDPREIARPADLLCAVENKVLIRTILMGTFKR